MYNDYAGSGPRSPFVEKIQNARSPMHTKDSSASFTLAQVYPLYSSGSSSTQCSFDLMKGRVDHLENERVTLSLQIQDQSEKERTRKLRIEQLESDVRSSQSSQTNLKAMYEDSMEKYRILRESKEELMSTIINLNERIEQQSKEASGAQNLWSKMTAASRELKRLEEENLKCRKEKTDAEDEKELLVLAMAKFDEITDRKQEEMTLLRLEIEGQRRTFKDSKSALESFNATLTAEIISSKSALQEALENQEMQTQKFLSEQHEYLNEIDDLRKQLNAAPRPSLLLESEELETITSAAIDDLRKKLLLSEMKRKQLHNTLQ